MTYVSAVKCPKCGKLHTKPLSVQYSLQIDLESGLFLIECPDCQNKIDLETAENMIAVKQEKTDVWF